LTINLNENASFIGANRRPIHTAEEVKLRVKDILLGYIVIATSSQERPTSSSESMARRVQLKGYVNGSLHG